MFPFTLLVAEDIARLHPGGVGSVGGASHHTSRPLPEEAAGVHHARAQPALPAAGLHLTQSPGHTTETGRARREFPSFLKMCTDYTAHTIKRC